MTNVCTAGAQLRIAWYQVSTAESAKPNSLQDRQAVEYARDGYVWHIHNCPQCLAYLAELNGMHDRTH